MPGEADKDLRTENKSLIDTVKESIDKTTHYISDSIHSTKDTFVH